MPYFDPRPKERAEDLFDREEELGKLIKAIVRGDPLVLILGLRRTGKTSLLRVGLNKLNYPSIVVDCRVFEEKTYVTYADFVKALEDSIDKVLPKIKRLARFVKSIRGISVHGFKIEFSLKEKPTLIGLLEALNSYASSENTRFIVAFDEAQELIKLRGIKVLPAIAYTYDNLRNVTIILTGSQVGLLYRFLKLHDPSSPIYGRVRTEIRLENFSKEKALEFLEKGFRQYGIKPPKHIIEEAVEKLGGNIGWLTFFGAISLREGVSMQALEKTLEEGSKLVLSELMNFLKLRPIASTRYLRILYALTLGAKTWSKIKSFLEIEEERKISDSILTKLLRNLLDTGFIIKRENEYEIADPILKYAIAKYGKQLISKSKEH